MYTRKEFCNIGGHLFLTDVLAKDLRHHLLDVLHRQLGMVLSTERASYHTEQQ